MRWQYDQEAEAVREAQRMADLTGAQHVVHDNTAEGVLEMVPMTDADKPNVLEVCCPR